MGALSRRSEENALHAQECGPEPIREAQEEKANPKGLTFSFPALLAGPLLLS
jgi:hypothetical protein